VKEQEEKAKVASAPASAPLKPKLSSIAPPTVAPRQNKAALLRAAKMAGATAVPAGGVKKARPVSTF
jgi:hypothetical protein